jgi:hypothetical protein
MYGVEILSCGMIFVPVFMKIGRGLQAILRFYLNSLKVYNNGKSD